MCETREKKICKHNSDTTVFKSSRTLDAKVLICPSKRSKERQRRKTEAIAAFQNENNELRIFETVIKFAFASHSMQEKTKRFFSCLHTACVYRSMYTYMCVVAFRGDSVISS